MKMKGILCHPDGCEKCIFFKPLDAPNCCQVLAALGNLKSIAKSLESITKKRTK